MKKILVAVPTKDRADMVEEVLRYELPYYTKYNIDICYYDSSTDNKTECVIEAVGREYGTKIMLKKENPDMCLDYKMVEMLKDFQNMDYDYYWLISDSISIYEEALCRVIDAAQENYDLIRLPLLGEGSQKDYVTCDVNDWFHNCMASVAQMASTVMSRTLLKGNIDWEGLRDKYVFNNVLDDKHGYFFTVGFYLEQIAQLDSFKGLFIGSDVKWRRDSSLKGDSYWKRRVFETWAKSYPETILKIPDIYTQKEEVIRTSDNIRPGRFSKEMFIHYRLNGLYDIGTYEKYKIYFKYITTETDECLKQIAQTPVEALQRDYPNLLKIETDWENKLDTIKALANGRKVYIYGAGFYGDNVIRKLTEDGCREQIKGVVVTSGKDNVKQLNGVNVFELDDVKTENEAYFILCALPGTASGMKDELNKRGITRYIGLFDV